MEESRTTLNHVNRYTVIVKPVDPHLRTRYINHVNTYTVIVKPVDPHLRSRFKFGYVVANR